MKLSVSNIGFRGLTIEEFGPTLQEHEINAVEISLSESFGSLDLAEISAKKYLDELRRYELQVSGIQSLLYGKNHLQFLRVDDWIELENHLKRIIRVASMLNTSVLVLGSPKNRLKGDLSNQEAYDLLEEFLSRLIPTLQENQVRISIEPNAAFYGADLLKNYADVIEFCTQVDSPWVVPQIDTGCLELEDNDLKTCMDLRLPSHIHLSAPGLGTILGNETIPRFIKQVSESNYQGWLTIEMLGDGLHGLEAMIEASRMIKNGI